MVAARIIHRDPESRAHRLPLEYPECLLRQSATGNAALFAPYIPMRAAIREAGFESVVIHRFPHDVQNAYFVMQT